MKKGNIGWWLKMEGDSVRKGDALCDVETDKATILLEATHDGVLVKILAPSNTQDVPWGKVRDALCDSHKR